MPKERFVVDEAGEKVGVLLDTDAAKAAGDQAIPLAQALREIEAADE